MDIDGRLALVTGAARRVGRSIALSLARNGVRVLAHARRPTPDLDSLLGELGRLGPAPEVLFADLADSAEVHRLASDLHGRFGTLDILVNNASVFYATPLAELDEEKWDEIMEVNLKAPFLCSLLFGRKMKAAGHGKIINIGDVAAVKAYRDYLPYCVSQAGLLALTRGAARLFAPEVQVTCVAPGIVVAPEGLNAETVDKLRRKIPLERFGTAEDVAEAVIFLARHGDFMTGSTIFLDGGRLIT